MGVRIPPGSHLQDFVDKLLVIQLEKRLTNTLIENSALIGSIILMFFGAIMIGRMWVMEGIPAQITAIMLNISKNRYMILLMCNVVLITTYLPPLSMRLPELVPGSKVLMLH